MHVDMFTDRYPIESEEDFEQRRKKHTDSDEEDSDSGHKSLVTLVQVESVCDEHVSKLRKSLWLPSCRLVVNVVIVVGTMDSSNVFLFVLVTS